MTDKQDPIAHAARLLREAAEELRQAHTLSSDRNNWIGEPEAKAAYDEHMAAAQALEDWEAAVGAGGVQALQPEGAPPGSGGWQHHAETMERERDHWRERARTMEEHQRGTVWYWQGDGNDHPESMVNSLPVVIRADQLRALIAGGVQALSAAPGPVSDTQHSQFLSDVLTAAGLITHGKRCKALGERLSDMVMRLRAAPQQEAQEPTEIPEEIERMAADRYKVVPSHESMFHRWAVVAGTGTQQLYLGREVECQNMARKFAGAFLDGAFVAMQRTAPQPAPAPLIARSLAEWHEQDGNVAWWAWNGREWAGEPAWIGTPNCEDWPGYHTHWTPHPEQPVCTALASQGGK